MKAKVALSVDKYKEEVMSKMTWMKKERRYGDRVANDITITMIKSNNPDRKIMQLIFRNGCETKISKTGYLMVGTYKNRCFFCQTNQVEGYKISASEQTKNKYVRVSTHNDMIQFIGDYELKHDDFLDMYYVEKEDH